MIVVFKERGRTLLNEGESLRSRGRYKSDGVLNKLSNLKHRLHYEVKKLLEVVPHNDLICFTLLSRGTTMARSQFQLTMRNDDDGKLQPTRNNYSNIYIYCIIVEIILKQNKAYVTDEMI